MTSWKTIKSKSSYINPIEQAWNESQLPASINLGATPYTNGMLISISNRNCQYETLVSQFKEMYISIINALYERNITRWSIQKLVGCWDYGKDKIRLPTHEQLLDLVIKKKNIIMVAGVHNYKKDDPRSGGREYCHSHFYLYNVHHHLPNNPVDLAKTIWNIEKNLNRYAKVPKRLQDTIRITEVGVGEHTFTDSVNPTNLYEYLRSPIDNPDAPNVINYIANNRHLPHIQYPLTTLYHK